MNQSALRKISQFIMRAVSKKEVSNPIACRVVARLNRMRYINRWPLMRCIETEDVAQHCYEVNNITLMLGFIDKNVFNLNTDPYKALAIAQVHEAEEAILTGDMNSVAKNATPAMQEAYKQLKESALEIMIDDIPAPFKDEYDALLRPEKSREATIAKFADIIQAHIKAKIEVLDGNERNFVKADREISEEMVSIASKDKTFAYYCENILPSHFYTVDDLLIGNVKQ